MVACLAFAMATLSAQARPAASAPALEPGIARLLAGIRAADRGQLAVSEEDGRFLRVLVGATNAKSVLEIGGASGYSAIWMGMGLRQTGGKLVTGTLNGGGPEISVVTMNGDVTLRQLEAKK